MTKYPISSKSFAFDIRRNSIPHFDAIYSTVEQCQAACATEVPRCNSVNYAPAKVLNRCERLLRIEWLVVELTTGHHSLHVCYIRVCFYAESRRASANFNIVI